MEKILITLTLLIIAFFAISPVLFYWRVGKRYTDFYLKMAGYPWARLLYRVILAQLIFFVFIFTVIAQGPTLWHAPALVLCAVLLPDRFTAAILRRLHDDRRAQLLGFALFFVTLAVPQLMTLSVAIGMLIIGAMSYPSWALSVFIMNYDALKDEAPVSNEYITHLYFLSRRASGDVSYLDQ